MSQRPPIQLLDAQLQAAGLQGVPEWYIRALRDPSVTLVDGRPKEEFLPFSAQSMEYPIQQQWLNSGNPPQPRPAPRRQDPARRADPFMDMQMPQVAIETPEVPMPRRPVSMDDLLSPEEIAANPVYDDPDTGTRLDAGLYANLPGEPNDPDRRTRQDAGLYANRPPRSVAPEASMTDDEVRAIYPRRMTMGLTPEEIAEIERRHAAMVANPQRVASDPTSLDPNDAAAVDIPGDPETGLRQDAGLYANLPPIEDQEAAARAAAPERPEREDWVTRRTQELVRRGRSTVYPDASVTPERARAQAEAEYDDPNGWRRGQRWSPQVRAAVGRQSDIEAAQRADATRASLGGSEPRFNASDFRRQREEAEAAQAADAQRKWDQWATGGSWERMARYAPGEYELRQQAIRDQNHKEYVADQQRRYDPTVDDPEDINPDTQKPWTRGERARQADGAKDRQMLARTLPQQNRALVRQLEQMGIDSAQFGDWRSPSFDRASALDTKNRAMARGIPPSQQGGAEGGGTLTKRPSPQNAGLGGRYGAVQRRAMARQNPWEYMGRGDINDEQRRTAAFILSGGRGATANDVDALNAKMLLEGIEQGARTNMRVQGGEAAIEAAAEQRRLAQMQAAGADAENFVRERGYRGWWGDNPLTEQDNADLVSYLMGRYGISEAEARGIASRYKVKPGRADATAPPAR